ncbi:MULTISPECIES: COX15/CtaA family protein [Candidatus Ichthyocystis]|uniref:Putative Cytochrome c oxidase assembly protein n=1 Tax=Candidatus Ichthyocystis hellenicum TaxID=1561003 RepID=A0A0S4M194_9BURK|nr:MULTISPECIES: COX15/CtaA family protein [Ichthyocystis]CUT17008.1 putative Cytochrome c oxidase assembly protein [Candidatus Ichthyocystis hellenicum]
MRALKIYRCVLAGVVFLAAAGIFLGSYVRLSNAGLGCPDWPGCYGHFWIPETPVDIHLSEKSYGSAFFSGLASKEMIHRYVVSTLGLVIVALFSLSFCFSELTKERPWAVFLLLLVVAQGVFGMWTVTLKLRPIIVTTHLIGGMLTFCLAVWMLCRVCYFQPELLPIPSNLRVISVLSLIMVVIQIVLGGWVSTNYAGLSCESLFKCGGKFVPDMSFSSAFGFSSRSSPLMTIYPMGQVTVLWLHRFWSIFVTAAIVFLSTKLYRQRYVIASLVLTSLVFVQVILGISNIVFHLPKLVAVSHTICAAVLLASVLVVNYVIFYSCSGKLHDDYYQST